MEQVFMILGVIAVAILVLYFIYWFFCLIKIALIDPLIAKTSNKPIIDKDPETIISKKHSSIIQGILRFLSSFG